MKRLPVAKLVPISANIDRRGSMGSDRGLFQVPDDFNSLPADLLAAFEGEEV